MPYNTRRKSLSLPALGIHLPNGSRVHRRPSLSAKSSAEMHDQQQQQHQQQHQPPAKRVKRSHSSASQSPPGPALSAIKVVTFAKGSGGRNVHDEYTPPPSPGAADDGRLDHASINDDLVSGVATQLEKTGNRPHLIKELAAVLSTSHDAVMSSANPAALLSSRLAAFMRRPTWSSTRPCPIAKELIPVHPRKVFYYLTTTPHQRLPSTSDDIYGPLGIATISTGCMGPPSLKRVNSPSLSNASVNDDDDEDEASGRETRKRAALSPSPEFELSYDLVDEGAGPMSAAGTAFPTPPLGPGSPFSSTAASMGRDGGENDSGRDLGLNRRAESPRLEGDEREFTATARGMRERGLSMDAASVRAAGVRAAVRAEGVDASSSSFSVPSEESEEERARSNRQAVAALFGAHASVAHGDGGVSFVGMSSPVLKAVSNLAPVHVAVPATVQGKDRLWGQENDDLDMGDAGVGYGWDMGRPETIALDELDDLFGGY